jgi:hypothetical protein
VAPAGAALDRAALDHRGGLNISSTCDIPRIAELVNFVHSPEF